MGQYTYGGKSIKVQKGANVVEIDLQEVTADITTAQSDITSIESDIVPIQGASSDNEVANKTVILDGNKRIIADDNVLNPAGVTGVVQTTWGVGALNVVQFELTNVAVTVGNNVSLAGAIELASLRVDYVIFHSGFFRCTLDTAGGEPTTATPELSLGAAAASGANATLSSGQKDLLNDLSGVLSDTTGGDFPVVHNVTEINSEQGLPPDDIWLNFAAAWPVITDTSATISGRIQLVYSIVRVD